MGKGGTVEDDEIGVVATAGEDGVGVVAGAGDDGVGVDAVAGDVVLTLVGVEAPGDRADDGGIVVRDGSRPVLLGAEGGGRNVGAAVDGAGGDAACRWGGRGGPLWAGGCEGDQAGGTNVVEEPNIDRAHGEVECAITGQMPVFGAVRKGKMFSSK